MAYSQAGWPSLPYPAAYVAPGSRPWVPPPGFPPPQAYAYPVKPPEPPPKDDYWATELNDNPLGLENMDIRAEPDPKGSDSNTSSSSTTRVPSSSVYSRASDYAARNSYPPPNATGKNSSLTPSRSHPNTRGPSPARPRYYERTSERDREIPAPTARFASNSSNQSNQTASIAQTGSSNTNHPPSTYQRPSSRSHTGRTSVPAEPGGHYSLASSAAAYAAQMANRSQTLPGASYHSRASAAIPGSGSHHAQAIQRSRTLPNEVLATNTPRERTKETSRRSSDHYAYRYPDEDEDDDDETDLEDEEDRSLSPSWVRVKADGTARRDRERKKNSRAIDRDADWINNAQRAGSPLRGSHLDPSGREDRSKRSREKLKPDSHQQAYAEGGYDVHRHNGTHDASRKPAAEYAHERHQERDAVEGRPSAPYSTYNSASVFDEGRGRSVGLTNVGAAIITEEPADMHGKHSTRRSQPYYPHLQKKEQEPKRSYREESYSESSSGSGGEDDAPQLGRRHSAGERQGSAVSITRTRRVSDRGDTVHPEDGENLGTATQAIAYLPSPRSLRQSNRTPSTRPSYEQVVAERDHDRTKTPNGHVPVSVSSASAAAARGHVYGTPPVTPNRQDQTHRVTTSHPSYVSQPTSSASAATLAAGTDSTRTPPRSTYIYGGRTASPSPRYSTSSRQSSRSYAQPSQYLQPQVYTQEPASQYVASHPTETRYKPHASRSRSPSPLPPGQKISSSSSYYATLGHLNTATPSRTQARTHGHGQAYDYVRSQTQARDGRQRSSSRAGVRGNGYSSASASAAAASAVSASASANPATQAGSSGKRHVRAGFWNRRGDYLTEKGYVVYCPPGRCYPRDLRDYPDNAFKDHLGNVAEKTADAYPELPESIPRIPGRAPERPYDSFISYVLVTDK